MKRTLLLFFTLILFSGALSGQTITAPEATKVWDIYSYGRNCYGQDLGTALHRPGWDRTLLFYGAVTDQFGALKPEANMAIHPSCGNALGEYSENIWVTWSMTDGKTFGQKAIATPPLLLLSSLDFGNWYDAHSGAPLRNLAQGTGWLIGDPAVEQGPSGTWYMFFDTQPANCSSTPEVQLPQNGIYVATSDSWHEHWKIQGKISAPGKMNFAFPSLFREPTTGELILYYNDANITLRAAKVVDDSTGTTLEPLDNGNPVIPGGCCTADRISVFAYAGKYYAVTDRFGEGTPESLNTFFLLGPELTPYGFDWRTRKTILSRADGTFYNQNMWAPSVVTPQERDTCIRIYFWAMGTPGCWYGGHESAGLLELSVNELP